jgi:protein SCO1/2
MRSAVTTLVLTACIFGTLSGCKTASKRYELRGQVLGKSAVTDQLIVNHETIPGFMMAMTMPYVVKDPQGLSAVEIGDRITADVVVEPDNNFWLERVVITDKSGRGSVPVNAAPHALVLGESVPDVPFINQDGKTVHLDQFNGKTVLITFIYTQCPYPKFCPLISSEFGTIHRMLTNSSAELEKTHMVSITLDPENDTPPVLKKYGLIYLGGDPAGFNHWDFLATTPADLHKLAIAFGLDYSQKENQIAHSMNTILLAPDATVAMMWPGNEWQVSEVLGVLRHTISASLTRN